MGGAVGEAATVAERLATRMAAGEIGEPGLYAPDAMGWHNTNEVWAPLTEAPVRMAAVRRLVPDFHAEDIEVHPWAGGFAIQYVFVGTTTTGKKVRIVGCLVAAVVGGRITRLQEYVDSAHAAVLRDALGALAPR